MHCILSSFGLPCGKEYYWTFFRYISIHSKGNLSCVWQFIQNIARSAIFQFKISFQFQHGSLIYLHNYVHRE